MSRRHRGRPHHHAPSATELPRRGAEPTGSSSRESNAPRTAAAAPPRAGATASNVAERDDAGPPAAVVQAPPPITPAPPVEPFVAAHAQPPAIANGAPMPVSGDRMGQCTAPQLRRFIKSRPYVPMHELRRRFSIDGGDDDVTPVRIDPGWIFVGLPSHEGHLLGDLLRTGEIGYELSLDPRTPVVVGVYPMRPIPRN